MKKKLTLLSLSDDQEKCAPHGWQHADKIEPNPACLHIGKIAYFWVVKKKLMFEKHFNHTCVNSYEVWVVMDVFGLKVPVTYYFID